MTDQGEMFEGPKPCDVTMLDKIQEVERELGYRKGVYSRLVADGKMTQHTADRRILVMRAVLADLNRLLECENDYLAAAGQGIKIEIPRRD